MLAWVRYIIVISIIAYYSGCAKKRFSIDSTMLNAKCNDSNGCVTAGGMDIFNYQTLIGGGSMDILIVDDNSGSMSFEQNHMASRLSNLLGILDNKKIDYRIAVTTTDISSPSNRPRAINGNGALQDGNLIALPDSSYFLTPSSGNSAQQREAWFAGLVQRGETQQCENFLRSNPFVFEDSTEYMKNCPSSDERAIYAANLVLKNNPNSFLRQGANLAIIILSDEDTRSSYYFKVDAFKLDAMDTPAFLIKNARSLYPDKSVVVHSIIVRPGNALVGIADLDLAFESLVSNGISSGYKPEAYFAPGDSTCLNAQSNQLPGVNISGSYGYLYSALSVATGGVVGDICANDYGSQLATIGDSITVQIQDLNLRCSSPRNVVVTWDPNVSNLTYEVLGAKVHFSRYLPVGTRVNLHYECPTAY